MPRPHRCHASVCSPAATKAQLAMGQADTGTRQLCIAHPRVLQTWLVHLQTLSDEAQAQEAECAITTGDNAKWAVSPLVPALFVRVQGMLGCAAARMPVGRATCSSVVSALRCTSQCCAGMRAVQAGGLSTFVRAPLRLTWCAQSAGHSSLQTRMG